MDLNPEARANGFSLSPLKAADQHHQFQRSLPNPALLLLITTASDGYPVGKICFDQQPLTVQDEDIASKVGLSSSACADRFDLTADLLRVGLQVMRQIWVLGIGAGAEVLASKPGSKGYFNHTFFVQTSISPSDTRLDI